MTNKKSDSRKKWPPKIKADLSDSLRAHLKLDRHGKVSGFSTKGVIEKQAQDLGIDLPESDSHSDAERFREQMGDVEFASTFLRVHFERDQKLRLIDDLVEDLDLEDITSRKTDQPLTSEYGWRGYDPQKKEWYWSQTLPTLERDGLNPIVRATVFERMLFNSFGNSTEAMAGRIFLSGSEIYTADWYLPDIIDAGRLIPELDITVADHTGLLFGKARAFDVKRLKNGTEMEIRVKLEKPMVTLDKFAKDFVDPAMDKLDEARVTIKPTVTEAIVSEEIARASTTEYLPGHPGPIRAYTDKIVSDREKLDATWDSTTRGPRMSDATGDVIFRYQVPILERFTLDLPGGAQIIRVAMENGFASIWAVVNTNAKLEKRYFHAYKTGARIERRNDLHYLGFISLHVQMELGLYLFEDVDGAFHQEKSK